VRLVALLAELMAIPTASRYPPLVLTPEERRVATLSALGDQLDRLAAIHPVLLVLEDAQWIDPTTRELIERTVSRLHRIPILVLITSRQEDGAAWLRYPRSTHVKLSKLGRDDCVQIVFALTAGKALPDDVVNAISERTAGIPLFVEELTKAVLQSPHLVERDRDFVLTTALPLLVLPTTLRDWLMARLDLLGAGKYVVQLGAVLGHAFSYELLRHVAEITEESLLNDLEELVDAGLLVAKGKPPEAHYAFKHVLIQEAAYESLLQRTRRRLHERVAAVLHSTFSEYVDTAPELLARHLSGAEAHPEAARQWQRAGALAAQRSAIQEAVLHFEKGLSTLKLVSPTKRDRSCELDMLLRLAGALRATRGYAALDVERVCRRALKLARKLGTNTSELHALNGLYSFHLVRSEYGMAEKRALHMLQVATRANDATYTMVAHRAVGAVSFHTGKLLKAEQTLQLALDLYDKNNHAHLATVYGSDHAETCACFLSLTKWVLGAPQDAIALQNWAVEHAHTLNHAHSLAQAYAYRSFLYCLVGDVERIESDGRSALNLAVSHGLKLMRAFADCLLAIAETMRTPNLKETIALSDAVDRLHAVAPNALRPYLLSVVADCYRRQGLTPKGLELLDEADAIIQQTTERWASAEVGRVRGALFADDQRICVAEQAFRASINTARAQSARSWMLRTGSNLADLLRNIGRTDESRIILDTTRGTAKLFDGNER